MAAAYARPIFQLLLILLPVLAMVAAYWDARRIRQVLLPYTVITALTLAPWYVAHYVSHGVPFFVQGSGTSLANYLGDRRLLGHFPVEYGPIEEIYAREFHNNPSATAVPWWEARKTWPAAYEKMTGRILEPASLDSDMARTSLAVLARNPGYYFARWCETRTEFSTSSWSGGHGTRSPVTLMVPVWRAFWSYAGPWIPFAVLFCEVTAILSLRLSPLRVLPIAVYLTTAVASTAIEPWPGQIRYRAPVDAFLVAALTLLPTVLTPRGPTGSTVLPHIRDAR